MWVRRALLGALLVSGLIAVVWTTLGDQPDTHSPRPPAPQPVHEDKRTVSAEDRADALARAQVWRPPPAPISRAELAPGAAAPAQLDCRFKVAALGGTTPKFHCVLPTGVEVRAKYGSVPEIPAEAAATRLLRALGFGADAITLVARVRCYGCPRDPFTMMKVVETTRTRPVYERVVDPRAYEDFEWASIEEKFAARPIETPDAKGWGFFELDAIDPSRGGAARAHVDALRLIAVFLAHWDNKAENQRLVCLSSTWAEGTPCREPFLLLQDVGATFGPRKADLDGWERAALWEDRAACTLSMKGLPYYGGTFGSARVSEAGRRFVIDLLTQLTDAQLADLFAGARFDKQNGLLQRARPVSEWVRVFKQRLQAISEGPACPAA
jgi:hypothetical protein